MLSLSSLPRMAPPAPSSQPGFALGRHLNPPTSGPEGGLNQLLQQALRELNLPETEDLQPGVGHSDQCLCVLGSPLPYLSMLLEAGQRSPGDALLCLSPSWLSRSSSSALMLHKAVTFDLGGRTFLSSFNPPRKVTYFLSCDPYLNEEVTRGIDCPTGSSGSLVKWWGDVLMSRVLLQKTSIHTPPTLALLNPSADTTLEEGVVGSVELVLLGKPLKSNLGLIRNKVFSFLDSKAVRHSDQVVLRRSGSRRGVEQPAPSSPVYLSLHHAEELWAGVLQLLAALLPGEAALLEAFCRAPKNQARPEVRTWEKYTGGMAQTPDLTFRLCAVVTRSPQNTPLLYKLVCRVGASDVPLSHHQSLGQSLETTLKDCGFADPVFAVSLRRLATKTALDCLRLIMETESNMSAEERGSVDAQTDMIGVDLLFTSDGATIKPVVLGFHPNLSCLHHSHPDPEGEMKSSDVELEACRGTLLLTPLLRSQHYLMRGKVVLVIGAGGYSKNFIWETARRYQLKIILVDSDPNHFASKMVDHFFAMPDLADHQQDEQHCGLICDWLAASDLHPDGCVCFWDDCVVLTSQICDKLHLRGPPPEAVSIAKEKSRTHLHLLSLRKTTGIHRASVALPSGQADGQADVTDRNKRGTNGSEEETLRALAEFGAGNFPTTDTGRTPCGHSPLVDSPRATTYASSPSTDDSFHPCVPLLSPSPSCYAVPSLHVESVLDLKKAAERGPGRPGAGPNRQVRFPAVMKLEYGAGAVGVRKVDSLAQSVAHFERIGGDLREDTDYPGIGLGWGNAMTLMEYVGGTEHDIDVIIFAGQLEGAFVSDNGPTRPPTFTETAAQMPTGLAADKRGQLIAAAYHACLGCGLRDGVYNVEMKMTELGPRLIEINARMGGFYLRDWILQLYGVDLLLAAFMVACGVRPRLPSASDLPAGGHFAGVMCVVSQHLQALRTTASLTCLRSLHRQGAIFLNELAAADELIAGEYEEPFCNVAVRDACAERARQRLLAVGQALGLHCPPHYDLTYFLSQFS